MTAPPPDLLRPDSDRRLDDIDQRMRVALTAASRQSGFRAWSLMDTALARPAPRDHGRATKAYFGRETETVLECLRPMLLALNQGMPGFNEWLDRTGYGDDVLMIRALLAWLETDPEIGAIASRLRHGVQGLQ